MRHLSGQQSPKPQIRHFSSGLEAAQYWFNFGFAVIPIIPDTKKPAVRWDPWLQKLSHEEIQKYWHEHPDHDVGFVVAPTQIVFDADSPEAEEALCAIEKAHGVWPALKVKTSRGFHHFFRLVKGTHVRSDSHSSEQFPHRIDVKADGGQIVLTPSSGKKIVTLDVVHFCALSFVGQAFIDSVFLHNSREVPRPAAVRAADASPATPTSIEKIAALLKHLDASCGHDDWVRVLMAVFHETQGSQAGLELANDWSSHGSTYKGRRDIETQWRSFRSDHPNPITVGTLIKMAREAGADTNAIMQTGEKFELCEYEAVEPGSAPPAAVADDTPLSKYSLLGHSEELEKQCVGQVTIFGNMILQGQASVIYAKPNTGKTLMTLSLLGEAIQAKRIDPSKVYYINMDDNGHGLAEKSRIADDFGFHMLADGHRGFEAKFFRHAMDEMIATDTARGVIIVLDTLRKFVDTMSKDRASEFAGLIRRFILKGGTVVALAHTNKKAAPDGKPIYAGTTDIIDNFDCAFTLAAADQQSEAGRKVVVFENIKRRGNVALSASYSYAVEGRISYAELLMSVEVVSTEQLLPIQKAAKLQSDDPVIAAVTACIHEGIDSKMKLADAAADRAKVSKRVALAVIERYSGNDPAVHRWKFEVRARGAKVFVLLEAPLPGLAAA
ncbi:MAG: PriCT-2 domain-containing protein [Candidatus Accumulibacter delftensis]|jgi:hypothetical protein